MTKHDEQSAVTVSPEANGQVASEELLVRTFTELRDDLMSTLVYVLGNREDAHDAAQESFMKCWNARDQLHEVRNLRAWIFRVAFNTAKDLQRSAWQRRSRPLKAEQYTMAAREQAPGAHLERKEEVERLRLALLELRAEEKEVFLLRQNGDMTYEEIAQLRECPVGTVKTQMRAALEKLRKVLVPST